MKEFPLKSLLPFCIAVLTILACSTLSFPGRSGNDNNAGNSAQSAQPLAGNYFQENFNGNLNGWSHFVVDGKSHLVLEKDPSNMSLGVQDGNLLFNLQGKNEWVYSIYTAQTYDDVRINVSANNSGVNDNNISLVCRYSPGKGWYEFNVANNGLYNIYFAQKSSDNKIIYSPIADGGSNKVKQGKNTNLYSVICQGHTLTLYINNIETRQIDDNQYMLANGNIGLSVSSFNEVPAVVGFDWVKVSLP